MLGYINMQVRKSCRIPSAEDRSSISHMLLDTRMISYTKYASDHNTQQDDLTQHAVEADPGNIGHQTRNNPLSMLAPLPVGPLLTVSNCLILAVIEIFEVI